MTQQTLGFIGGGNMAEAILGGVLASGMAAPEAVCVSDPSADRRAHLAAQAGVATFQDNAAVMERAGVVVLAIKPQVAADVVPGLAAHGRPDQLFVSILAGTPATRIEQYLATDANPRPRVVRVMPNTPAMIGRGMAGIAAGTHAGHDDVAVARRIFDAVGRTLVVEEDRLHAITAISGSGPAYFFYVIEALMEGATELGFTEEEARALVLETARGAVELAAGSDKSPEELRRAVTSPGGTTAAGIAALDAHGARAALRACMDACEARSRALASDQ